jgi:hypothetical protein
MAENTLFKPRNAPIRQPTSNARQNGVVTNPPRLSEIGGMKNSAWSKNNQTLRKPGDTR